MTELLKAVSLDYVMADLWAGVKVDPMADSMAASMEHP